jgi:Flp pilus assembly protein TadG
VTRVHGRSQRSQALTEFALVMPLLLLLMVGIFDFGRLLYAYATIDNAANEAARTAVHAPQPGLGIALPTDADVMAAARARSVAVPTSFGACANGPIPASGGPPGGTAWLYITSPGGAPLAPGGQTGPPAGCATVTPASGHVALKVTVLYHFEPVTPILAELVDLTLRASATYQTEY